MDKNEQKYSKFPPVVAVLGHVDHGKTTLLDTIRKTSVAVREHGGITQKIGASVVETPHEGKKRKITFIDTPGHEAFAKMRGRGAQAADIALLIVSAVDGVMPQTKESIELIKALDIPYIVVLTKIDSEQKNPDKAKQQLASEGIDLEGFGGQTPVIEVSAKTGTNIKELLDLILLVYDIHPKEGLSSEANFSAVVIESKQDNKSGPKATVVVKNGKISVREEIVSSDAIGKVKSLIDPDGKQIQEATIGEAVEILGFEKVPEVGSTVTKGSEVKISEDTSFAEAAAGKRDEEAISLILVADTLGSLEAIVASLPAKINLVSKKTGEPTTADVFMAKSVSALILSFNTKIRPDVQSLALNEKVIVKNYEVIYEMLKEIEDVVEGKRLSLIEEVYGVGKVLASFPFDKQIVMGIKVLEGRVAKGDKVRIERGEEIIGEGRVQSLRQGKEQTSKAETGEEAGIIIGPPLDFTIGDMVICHS